MRYAHAMPFGAECRTGATRFRLWAPACPRVLLELGRGTRRSLAMEALPGGWHELVVDDVGHGAAYAFRLGGDGPVVPDPASRSNPWDVLEPSVVVDPRAHEWAGEPWRGRPWHEAVVYELHVGTFTRAGTFRAAIERLDHLARLGVTAIELMPVADWAGSRGWGYDGVLPFAPDAAYGFPHDLKALVEAAHARGLMVLLDVVYNHFGPEGNFLGAYAPAFFNPGRHTPWGAAINFDAEHSRTVRDFFVHNALFWIDEYRFDGLRLDAVHAVADDSPTTIVEEIAAAIAAGPRRERHVHLVLENDANDARPLERGASAQWNDDMHHALHVLATGEADGYYRDYAADPVGLLGRALAEGFAYQGERSAHRGGAARGTPCAHLPLTAFVNFVQDHDQVGNRALGERLDAIAPPGRVRLARAILLLAPSVPMLFMGEEFAAATPFLYFCDFAGDLARAVREGRRNEFAAFERFAGAGRESIPDPGDPATFRRSRLDWDSLALPQHARALEHCRELLRLRGAAIVPRLAGGARGAWRAEGSGALAVDWTLGDGSRLRLRANLGAGPVALPAAPGRRIHSEGAPAEGEPFPPWTAAWSLEEP